MLKNKFAAFALVTINTAFLFSILNIITFVLTRIILSGNLNRFPDGGREFFGLGLVIGIIHAATLSILFYRNKSVSTLRIFLSTFLIVDIWVALGIIWFWFPNFYKLFNLLSSEVIYEILSIELIQFLKYSVFLLIFSIIAGIANKFIFNKVLRSNKLP